MVLNSAGFKRSIQNVQSQANSASNKMAASFRKIGTAIAAAFSVKMITAFGKSCIDLGSDLAEVQNVVDVTFTSMSDSVNKWAKSAASSYGLSETMAKKYVGTFGSMAEAFGFTEKQSYDMATALAGLTGDVASFYNLTQDEAYTKLKSVFSGETESLKDLGVVMTQSALDSYALSNGFGKTTAQMTEAEKVTLRYNFVLNQLKNASGDFARTQNSWANQTRILQLRFDSLKATLGQGLINVFTPVIKVANSLIERLTTVSEKFKALTEQVFGNAGGAAESAAGSIANAANSVNSLTDVADGSSSALDNIADSAEKAKKSVAGFDKLNVLSQPDKAETNSTTPTNTNKTTASTGGLATASTVKSIGDRLKNTFNDLYEKSGFKTFVEKIQRSINKVNWNAIGENCKSIFKNAIPIAQSYVKGVAKTGKSAFSAVGSFVGGIVQVGGKQLQTLTGGISKWLEKDGKKIKAFFENYFNNISSGFDNLSTFFDGWFGLIGESVDRMRPVMKNAISDLLSGFTDFGIGVGTIVSEGFNIATNSLVKWIKNDGAEIGLFFDNLQLQIADVMSFIGGVFSDIGTIISDWWNGEGSSIFQNVCDMFTNIGTTFMNVYNDWIMPVWDFIVSVMQSAWDNCIKPIFEQAVSFFGKLADCISTVWNNFLSPIVNWLVDFFSPIFTNVFNAIKGVFDTVFTFIGDLVSGLWKSLGGLLDFITGVFSGDWKKVWQGISDFFGGIWDGIYGIFKGAFNLIIDGINLLWTGIYNVVSGIVNGLGGIAGALGDLFGQDWHFSMPEEVPLIPKLAKGGIIKAPTLAVVGDNAGANTGNPEVVAPLNKLQGMIDNSGSGYDTKILVSILNYLKRIYEMFVLFRNNGGNEYEFVATVNSSTLFKEFVKEVNLYKRRHNGALPF